MHSVPKQVCVFDFFSPDIYRYVCSFKISTNICISQHSSLLSIINKQIRMFVCTLNPVSNCGDSTTNCGQCSLDQKTSRALQTITDQSDWTALRSPGCCYGSNECSISILLSYFCKNVYLIMQHFDPMGSSSGTHQSKNTKLQNTRTKTALEQHQNTRTGTHQNKMHPLEQKH